VSRYLDRPQTQSGSHVAPLPAPRRRTAGVVWGTRGPEFKSRRPDTENALLEGVFRSWYGAERRPAQRLRPGVLRHLRASPSGSLWAGLGVLDD
jgi:hypothetical protein